MGNTEFVGATDISEEEEYETTPSKAGSIPHLTNKAIQPLPSFIIKNSSVSTSQQESRWCRVRIVLLQQTQGSRTVLYDSKKSFMKTFHGAHDKKMMGNLVFGSAPFVHSGRYTSTSSHIKSISTKIHYLPYFRQTIVSKLFHLRIPKHQMTEVLYPTTFDSASSSESSSSSFSDSDDGLSGHMDRNPSFAGSDCFECKPLFALVVIFEMFVPTQSSMKNASPTIPRNKSESQKKKKGTKKKQPLTPSQMKRSRVTGSLGEDSTQEMVKEKRKMIELQAFIFCSLSVLISQIKELQEEVCKSLRKTIVKVMKKWKKKKKKSIGDLITPPSSSDDYNPQIRELNLKLSSYILDHDPPFLSHCRHFEQYVLTYLHAQKSSTPETGRDGGRMVPGGHGFFSRGGGLWQKVLMSGTGTSPRGLMPRSTWKNDGRGYGDPLLNMNRASASLKTVWTQLEEDILKLIHYISKRKMIHMGWTKEAQPSSSRKGKGGSGSKTDPLKVQQPLERRVMHLTKRFLCSVLTAIFSHHTGWIFPFVRDGNRTNVEDQFESIFGSRGIGKDKTGTNYCKVLVVGNDYKIVRQLLVVLSFFLRSNPYLMKQYSINPSNQSLSSSKYRKSSSERGRSKEDEEMILKLYEILPIERFLEGDENEEEEVKKGAGKKEEEGKRGDVVDKKFLNYKSLISKNMYFSHHLSIPFGESLVFSEILPKYCPAYVLSALPKNADYFEGTIRGLRWDLEKCPEAESSCCVVVDMNDLMCNVVMAHRKSSSGDRRRKRKGSGGGKESIFDSSDSQSGKKSSGKISIDFTESTCSPFVLELFNQTLEIFGWGKELKNQHLLLNNFFNQKLKEAIILAQLVVDWLEKERSKHQTHRKKKEKQVDDEEEEEGEGEGEESEEDNSDKEEDHFEIDEKRVCRELNIPTKDLPIIKNIIGYIHPSSLGYMKNMD